MFGFKVINQYEQGLVFRWGKLQPAARQPGLTWVNPFTDRLRKVNMQIIAATIPGQEGITRDNVTVRVDAVVYYRVVNPVKAILNVQDYTYAVAQVAQTSLRSVIGQSDMDQLLSERAKVNAHLKDVIDAPTEEPWGIRVERVELKDISLPESMKRSMSRQAEAERERRARITTQATLRFARTGNFVSPQCHHVTVMFLRIFPPGDPTAVYAGGLEEQVCAQTTLPTMTITTVIPDP